ncbi:MAG: DUF350 domain-containing protein [Gammaproteobacteria bacterium]|nr:DUF350 domain-containing protein [Gammaproteobacteria bacterium]
MENITQMIMLSDASIVYYVIDFIIIMGFMAILKFLAGSISDVSLKDILAKQDNFSAGITMAGAIIAVAILMMGVAAGDAGHSYTNEITLMVVYGVAAMVFMWLTRKIFDRFILSEISIHDEILKGNAAAGITDAFNMIASAIIIRGAMTWVDGSTFLGLVVVAIVFILSQFILLFATIYRSKVFDSRHKSSGRSLQSELQSGNIALAIRFSGHRLGLGLALTAASGVVIYDPQLLVMSITAWLIIALMLFALQIILAIVLRHIILSGVNVGEEVGEQRNVAIGSIEAAIYVGIGLIFIGLLV